jgi:hypothetical protein
MARHCQAPPRLGGAWNCAGHARFRKARGDVKRPTDMLGHSRAAHSTRAGTVRPASIQQRRKNRGTKFRAPFQLFNSDEGPEGSCFWSQLVTSNPVASGYVGSCRVASEPALRAGAKGRSPLPLVSTYRVGACLIESSRVQSCRVIFKPALMRAGAGASEEALASDLVQSSQVTSHRVPSQPITSHRSQSQPALRAGAEARRPLPLISSVGLSYIESC